MLDINEIRKEVRSRITVDTVSPKSGGQQCGIQTPVVRLHSEDLGITMESSFYRSKRENTDLLMTVFDLLISDLIK